MTVERQEQIKHISVSASPLLFFSSDVALMAFILITSIFSDHPQIYCISLKRDRKTKTEHSIQDMNIHAVSMML